jgi:hypothetical protein
MKITELFPIKQEVLPDLLVYKLTVMGNTRQEAINGKIRYRLENQLGGHWIWDDELQGLVTDTLVKEADLETFLGDLQAGPDKAVLAGVKKIALAPNLKVSTASTAKFVAKALLDDVNNKIREVLDQARRDRGIYSVNTSCYRRGWVVDGQPAVSLSLQRTLDTKLNLREFIARFPQDGLVGLLVIDITKPDFQSSMAVTKVIGLLGGKNRRQWLLGFNPALAIAEIIKQVGDDEIVVETDHKYHYPASALGIRIRTRDYIRFGISENLDLSAVERIELLRPITKIMQQTGLVGEAYREKHAPHLFISPQDIGHKPTLRFGQEQIGGVSNRFECVQKFGLFQPKNEKKIRIAVVNAAPGAKLDYLKTLFREIFQGLGYSLVSAGEKQVERPSETVLETAISQLVKHRPDIVLAIIPEAYGSSEATEWTIYDYFRQSILQHALQEQVVQPQDLNNREVIHNLILGILAKTGNVPYVLASSIGYADFIVGLDWPANFRGQGSHDHTTMARIYFRDGQFDHLQTASRRQGENRAVQILFPASQFTGKKIVLHRYGRFQAKEREVFSDWGHSIGATFYFVEIMRSATLPRIYDIADKGMRASKGSIFRLSETEALLVASQFGSESPDTPQPIHVKTYLPFSLRYALHSVLSFTLLHYGEPAPGLPVTVYYGNKILRMANAIKSVAAIPFWL